MPKLARGDQHQTDPGLILAHGGMFTGYKHNHVHVFVICLINILLRPCYPYNENPDTCKTTSLY